MTESIKDQVELRYTVDEDAPHLKNWLMEPDVLLGFPMLTEVEVDDSVKHWISFHRLKCSLTALIDGEPVGIATLCLMPYQKIRHHALVSIMVAGKVRGKGVGTVLLNNLIHLAKNYFSLEYLYLEVYEGNRAITLYQRFGFKEVGRQPHFMKEGDRYVSKIIMERKIL
jgi:RimJ/RimL family protein N-acetyltransferase